MQDRSFINFGRERPNFRPFVSRRYVPSFDPFADYERPPDDTMSGDESDETNETDVSNESSESDDAGFYVPGVEQPPSTDLTPELMRFEKLFRDMEHMGWNAPDIPREVREELTNPELTDLKDDIVTFVENGVEIKKIFDKLERLRAPPSTKFALAWMLNFLYVTVIFAMHTTTPLPSFDTSVVRSRSSSKPISDHPWMNALSSSYPFNQPKMIQIPPAEDDWANEAPREADGWPTETTRFAAWPQETTESSPYQRSDRWPKTSFEATDDAGEQEDDDAIEPADTTQTEYTQAYENTQDRPREQKSDSGASWSWWFT